MRTLLFVALLFTLPVSAADPERITMTEEERQAQQSEISEEDREDFELTVHLATDLRHRIETQCSMTVSEADLIRNSPLFRKLLVGVVMDVGGNGEQYYLQTVSQLDCPHEATGQAVLP